MSDDYVECPYCLEDIRPEAIKCRHCKSILKQAGEDLYEDAVPDIESIRETEPPDAIQVPTLGLPLKIWSALFLVSMVLTFLTSGGWLGLLIPLDIIFFIGVIAFLVRDIRLSRFRKCETAEKAVRHFYERIKVGHFDYAYDILSRASRNDEVREYPAITELNFPIEKYSFGTLKGFTKHWKSCIRPRAGMVRIVRRLYYGRTVVTGNVASTEVGIELEVYPTYIWLGILGGLLVAAILYAVTRKSYVLKTNVVSYDHGGRWWIHDGSLTRAVKS